MKRKLYLTYKPSDIEGFEKNQESWENVPLKRIFRIINGATPDSRNSEFWNGDIPWVTPEDLGELVGDTIVETRRMITKIGYDNCATTLVSVGSLVLSTRAPIGYIALAGIPLCTNQGCRSLEFLYDFDRRYFYYLFSFLKDDLESWGQGSTFKELNRSKLGSIQILLPSIKSQTKISSFLDFETKRIFNLIELKEKQIKLLQEKRQAIITQAVTKGLDPNVPMKNSGVEWLGKVPVHWEIKPLKYSVQLIIAKNGDLNSNSTYIGLENIESWTGVHLENEEDQAIEGQSNIFKSGDVLFGKLRPYLAKVYCAKETGICSSELLVIRSIFLRQDFLFYYMISKEFIETVDSSTYGTKMPRANWEFIGKLPMLIPSKEEQTRIVDFINSHMSRIDTLIKKTRESIHFLNEYRFALITAAVMGKIDVRCFVPEGGGKTKISK